MIDDLQCSSSLTPAKADVPEEAEATDEHETKERRRE